jgi:hypothetical protein
MERFLRRTTLFRFVLALFMLADWATVQALADDLRAKVTKTEFSDDIIYVYYDLSGSPEEVYSVTLSMRKRSDPAYQVAPKFVSGDVGPNMFPGTGWRVAWSVKRDFPGGVDKKDVYFVIDAKPVGGAAAQSGSNTVLWVAGGAAAVGGIVALILSRGKGAGNNGGGGNGSSSFPLPPGRP